MLFCASLPPLPPQTPPPLLFIGWFFLFILLSILNYKRNPKRGVLDSVASTPLLAVSTSSHLHRAEHIESWGSLASSLTDLTLFLETHFPAQICTCFVISPVSPQVVWNSKTAVLVKRRTCQRLHLSTAPLGRKEHAVACWSLHTLNSHFGASPIFVKQMLYLHGKRLFFSFLSNWLTAELERLPASGLSYLTVLA